MKDEKLLKKIGKLLSLYGVSEEEKQNFLTDIADAKYDDEEEVVDEESKDEEIVDETPTDEEVITEETEEEETVDEKGEEVVEDENAEEVVENEEVSEEAEEVVDEPQKDIEEPEHKEDEESSKVIEGLTARITALENLIAKLGIPVDEGFGESPNADASISEGNEFFDRINRLRTGK